MSNFVYLRSKACNESDFSEVYLNLDDITAIVPSSNRVIPERCIDKNEYYVVHPDDMKWLVGFLGTDKVAFAITPSQDRDHND